MSDEVIATRQGNVVSQYSTARGICFFENHTKNKVGRLVPDLSYFLKTLYEVKAISLKLSFNIYFSNPQIAIQ